MAIIYVTDNKYKADLKVYKEERNKHSADMIYFETNNKYHAKKDHIWCFTDNKYKADKKTFWEKNKYSADIKVYETSNKYHAKGDF